MDTRRFDHFHVELSVAVGQALPRYDLWLALGEHDLDPTSLDRIGLVRFCDAGLGAFLHTRGLFLPAKAARRLRRAVARFDPKIPSPEERLAALIHWNDGRREN